MSEGATAQTALTTFNGLVILSQIQLYSSSLLNNPFHHTLPMSACALSKNSCRPTKIWIGWKLTDLWKLTITQHPPSRSDIAAVVVKTRKSRFAAQRKHGGILPTSSFVKASVFNTKDGAAGLSTWEPVTVYRFVGRMRARFLPRPNHARLLVGYCDPILVLDTHRQRPGTLLPLP